MPLTRIVDTLLDRTVVAGYPRTGIAVRRHLPGWPAGPERLDGRTAIVTGATSGIGLATAQRLAHLGAEVHLVGRSATKLAAALGTVTAAEPAATVEGHVCDVSSLAALDRFCSAWTAPLDLLVNNAGAMPPERGTSPDGVELTFATNVLGAWVLTDRLHGHMPSGGRIVNVTSGGMYAQRLVPDPDQAAQPYKPAAVYARSKRALMVGTEQWAFRLRPSGVTVNAMHPGWVDTPGVDTSLPLFSKVMGPVLRTPDEGADTVVWLCASPEVAGQSGLLWHDRRRRPTHIRPGTGETLAQREELWETCRTLAARQHVPSTVGG